MRCGDGAVLPGAACESAGGALPGGLPWQHRAAGGTAAGNSPTFAVASAGAASPGAASSASSIASADLEAALARLGLDADLGLATAPGKAHTLGP